jgi:membrane protein
MIDVRKRLTDFFARGLWEIDTGSLGKYKSFVIMTLRLLNVAFHEFTEGQLTLRAMSLVYSMLLSIVPVLAISFSVLKAFGVHNQIEPYLQEFLSPLGDRGEEITVRIISFIDNMKVGVLGSIGLAMLVYTVISVIQKIEKAFNYIWRIKRSRSLLRQFSEYTSVILIGPVIMFAAVGMTASAMSSKVMKYLTSLEPFGTLLYYAFETLPYIMVCGVFTFLYLVIPNTKVKFASALSGGVFAGVLWEIAGWSFATFTVTSAQYAAIYSGFAILVLFMIWLYVSWLILLVGAQISFYHQYPQFLSVKKETLLLSSRLREKIAFLIMYFIGYNFSRNQKPWTLNTLVEHMNLPVDVIHDAIILLEQNNLLLETGDDPPALIPARDIGTIRQKEIFNAVRAEDQETLSVEHRIISVTEVEVILKRMDAAYNDALGERTLRDIVFAEKK